jgi:hypothetical protein
LIIFAIATPLMITPYWLRHYAADFHYFTFPPLLLLLLNYWLLFFISDIDFLRFLIALFHYYFQPLADISSLISFHFRIYAFHFTFSSMPQANTLSAGHFVAASCFLADWPLRQ